MSLRLSSRKNFNPNFKHCGLNINQTIWKSLQVINETNCEVYSSTKPTYWTSDINISLDPINTFMYMITQ